MAATSAEAWEMYEGLRNLCKTTVAVSLRCCWCRFSFQEGEHIVVDLDGHIAHFPFSRSGEVRVGQSGPPNVIVAWKKYLEAWIKEEPGAHKICHDFAGMPPPKYGMALKYSFDPTPAEEARRYGRIRRLLECRLAARMEFGRLPLELWATVAKYLVYECATSAAQHALTYSGSNHPKLDLNRALYAHLTLIEGITYVAKVTNDASSQYRAVMILGPGRFRHTECLYVLQDHLGVRALLFADAEATLLAGITPKDGLWWKTVPLHERTLYFMSDGLKIRVVESRPPRYHRDPLNMLWETPMPGRDLMQVRSFAFSGNGPPSARWGEHIRMGTLELNAPGITGYSACYAGGIVTIRAHSDGEDLSFYRDFDIAHPENVWVYLPIDQDEAIEYVFGRCRTEHKVMDLMLVSNSGKMLIMTPFYGPSSRQAGSNSGLRFPWRALSGPSLAPTKIYYSVSRIGVYVIIMSALPDLPDLQLELRVDPPKPLRTPNYFVSHAELSNVVAVAPCVKRQHGEALPAAVTGLLLYYNDGRRACLGEVRLDLLGSPVYVGSTTTLNLGFAHRRGATPEVPPYVAEMCLGSIGDKGNLFWLSVPWKKELHWLFVRGHCKVYYEGLESPGYEHD